MKKEKLSLQFTVILSCYIFSLTLVNAWSLPLVGKKIQPPEIVFFALLCWFLFHLQKLSRFSLNCFPLKIPLVLLGFSMLVSAVFSIFSSAWVDVIGYIYLVGITLLISYLMVCFCENIPKFAFRFLPIMGLIASFLGIGGWLLVISGFETSLVRSSNMYFPYFGNIFRTQGLTMTPNFLFSILSVAIIFQIPKLQKEGAMKRDWLIFAVLIIAAVLTFAKSILLLLATSMWFFRFPLTKKLNRIIAFLLVTFVLGATHFLRVVENPTEREKLAYYADFDNLIWGTKSYSIYPSIYLNLKAATIEVGKENPFLGIGSGQFYTQIVKLKKSGHYPQKFPTAEPHSTYFGAWAELGFLGVFAVLYFFFAIYQLTKRPLIDTQIERSFLLSVQASLILFALEAISMDILNFRHYWLILAFLMAFVLQKSGHK